MLEHDAAPRAAIDALLAQKRASPEPGLSPQVPAIQDFIVRELARLKGIIPARIERKQSAEPRLSALVREVLRAAWD